MKKLFDCSTQKHSILNATRDKINCKMFIVVLDKTSVSITHRILVRCQKVVKSINFGPSPRAGINRKSVGASFVDLCVFVTPRG
jgi:hypothetical protein